MKIKGFTLFELIVTMSLFLSITLIGIASYTYLIERNEKQTIIDEIRTAI
ncbi:MAG: pilus assembly FimT family protein [Legionella sp.]